MNLFIDSDILLDALLLRHPHDSFAMEILSLTDSADFELYSSAHSLLDVYYFTSKIAGKIAAKKSLSLLEQKLNIVPTAKASIKSGLVSNFTDFEDAVQYAMALENNCQVIITRNIKDYIKSNIAVMTAEQYLKSLG